MRKALQTGPTQLVAILPEADPDALAETLVAFANADGGTIYVGVSEAGRPVGNLYPEEFTDAVEQAEALCRPPIPIKWEQVETGGRFVFVGRVSRSSDLHTLADGRVLVRTGPENRRLSGEEVRQLSTVRSTGEYEADPVPGGTRDDFDEETIREFLEAWEERQGHPLTRPVNDLFSEMGWLMPDHRATVAGILLFGKKPQMYIPRSGLTFVRFPSTEIHNPSRGKPGYGRRVEVRGGVAAIIKRTWEILQEEIRIGAVVQGLKREEQWMYPPAAIREALVNAVAHRDYRLHGRAIEVRMFEDRLEISSPGRLPGFITLDNIVDEHFSRNPRIVQGLYQWGYIEELGLGIDLMLEEMVSAGHPPPTFQDTEYSFTVVFKKAKQRSSRRLLQPETDLTMNERQAKALAYIQQHGRITNREYQKLCPDYSSETLRLDLVDLVQQGVLLKVGAKRGTHYILK